MLITTALIYLIIALVSVFLYFTKKRLNYWKDLGIAHDEPSLLTRPVKGRAIKRGLKDCVSESYSKYKGTGPFCGFYLNQRPAVLILEPALVKNVLIKDFSNFTDRGMYHNEKDDPLSGHLFLLDGSTWKNLRQKLSPTFTSGKMKIMYPTIIGVAEKFITVFAEMHQEKNVIEIKELLCRFTTDVIGTCAFGINCNSLQDPKAEFRLMGVRSLNSRRHGKFLNGFMQGFPELAKKLRMKLIAEDVSSFFMRIVRETVEYRLKNNIKTNDFLSILMDLKDGETNEEGVSLSLEEMAAQAFVFFLGGFETSSSTMGFALYELAQNQDIQQKMRDEIDEIFDDRGKATYEAIHGLQYMGQVISETLRKYTIVSILNRQALEDYVVPGNSKFVIKKGMPIIIPAHAIHHDAQLYPDPEIFDPERFTADAVRQRDSVEWLPFGDGPRNCIGLRFGLMQTRVGMAYLLRHFRFSVSSETEIPMKWNKKSFLLSSLNGIFLKVEKIC